MKERNCWHAERKRLQMRTRYAACSKRLRPCGRNLMGKKLTIYLFEAFNCDMWRSTNTRSRTWPLASRVFLFLCGQRAVTLFNITKFFHCVKSAWKWHQLKEALSCRRCASRFPQNFFPPLESWRRLLENPLTGSVQPGWLSPQLTFLKPSISTPLLEPHGNDLRHQTVKFQLWTVTRHM